MMKRVGVVLFPGFHILDVAPVTAFELANMRLEKKIYDVEMLSEEGGPVASSCGASIDSAKFGASVFDTVIVTGTIGIPRASAGLCRFLRMMSESARRVASVCTGAFLLAEAGLLNGRKATTHWHYAAELQMRFPHAKVRPERVFVKDGPIWTAAGMTSGIDLSLALIEDDAGADVSRTVARMLVLFHRRTSGHPQFSAMLDLAPQTDRVQKALAYARVNLQQRLSIDDLAAVAHLSPRQFSRAFKLETGESPARAIERLRIEAARALIEGANYPLETIARETGFTNKERMRRAFMRTLSCSPQALRRSARQ
jgi:transcriptional regulator GlxA family with amidase domain